MSGGIAIGIDLGTSNSCVSAVVNGKPQVLANAFGERTTASVVSFKEDGEILVGNQAKARIVLDPRHTVSSAKRLIGRYSFSEEVKKAQAIYGYQIIDGEDHSIRIRIRNEDFSLPEISAFVLREMKQLAEAALGQEVSQAVVTVPAYFNDNQRQATKDAGRIAGLEVLRVLNEPTAAALAYGYGRDLNQRVVIYDLGGGTFDVSVLAIGNDSFEVLSTCGDTYLGGDDFDDRLIDLFAERLQQEHGCNVRTDPMAFEKLRYAAEQAKIALSEADTAQIEIPEIAEVNGQSVGLSYELTRQEFDKLVVDLIQRTFKVCDEALQQASLIARDLDGVILVGGPTRLPMVRAAVKNYFQKEPKVDVDPDQVVAMGAAIHAATLVDTEHKAFLLDVTPHTLRIGVAGGLAEEVIERNTPVPIEQTRTFTTFQDDQDSVVIRVYQGEEHAAELNELLGQFEFSGFKKAARGAVDIDVTFEINSDGIVNVTARDRETGKQASTEITLASGLSEGEMRGIIEQNRTSRLETKLPEGSEKLGSVKLVSKPVATVPQAAEAIEATDPSVQAMAQPEPVPAMATATHEDVEEVTEEELDLLPEGDCEPLVPADERITAVDLDDDGSKPNADALFDSAGSDLSAPDDETDKG